MPWSRILELVTAKGQDLVNFCFYHEQGRRKREIQNAGAYVDVVGKVKALGDEETAALMMEVFRRSFDESPIMTGRARPQLPRHDD